MVSNVFNSRTKTEWLSSLPACILLLLVVIFSTSSDIHNQILRIGEHYWPGYYELRVDPVPPSCDPNINIEQAVQERLAESEAGGDDDFGLDLFAAEPLDPDQIRQSIENARLDCVSKFEKYEDVKTRITPSLESFRAVELFVSDMIAVGIKSQRLILVLVILLCATTATITRHHIAMRPVMSRMDHYFSAGAQTIANGLLFASSIAFRTLAHSDGSHNSPETELIHDLWVWGFGILALVSLINFFRPAASLNPGGNVGRALLSVPLYSFMAVVAATFFFLGLGGHKANPAALGIHLDKVLDLPDMFLNVGLYVWIGMMLKQTRFASLVLDVLKPLKMPPEMLAVVVVILAAIPTAYTGGSGIFVIAAGAVIYHELRAAGARRQLALAATAMSGSMGVVLRPCLLVVVVAFMNREVTTTQLFDWGVYVFLLSAVLFMIFAMTLNRQSKIELASPVEALPQMLKNCKPLIPYVICMVAVLLFYNYIVNVGLDEFTAARILPVMMLSILIFEHITKKDSLGDDGKTLVPHKGFEKCIRGATNQSTSEIGALLMLIGGTIIFGGVIERSGVVELFPSDFTSIWTAMCILVVVLVIMGMLMEPFGAVILVSQTIAPIAYNAGVDPVHFWMLTLVAFELGYLSPPVALNHLLTRQVVGEEEVLKSVITEGTFYERHEKILLPILTMGTALILVAFMPLLYQMLF